MATLNTRIVLRNDSTANWLENESVILLKGEVGVEFFADGATRIKIGDGVKTWAQLGYVGGEDKEVVIKEVVPTEGQTHIQALNLAFGLSRKTGDIGIIKETINADAGLYQYTAYVCDESKLELWQAMDGNYNAENVYFSEDLVTTTAIGNIKLTNGQATISAAGKNLKQVFDTIFVEEKNPTTTQPVASIALSGAGAKEVGTVFTPSYSASLSAGSYTYGPATGVAANEYRISDILGNGSTTSSGTFDSFTVEESTNYYVSAEIKHNNGTIPVTNTGNEYPSGQIMGGTSNYKTASSSKVTGYRAWFYGYKNASGVLDVSALTSAQIRALTSTNGSIPSTLTTDKMQQMFFAAPKGKIKSVAVANATNGAPQTVSGPVSVNVEGANGYTAAEYDVFYVSNASAESGSTKFNITITK